MKILGSIDTSGLINTGFAIITAKKKEQQPKINPPDIIPLFLDEIDSATANGKVRIAGVKLPSSQVKT